MTFPSPYDTAVLLHSPVGYFPMDEPSGSTMFDRSGNGNNGTYRNGPTLGTAMAFVAGDTGVAFVNNGDGTGTQYADIPNSALYQFGTGNFSLEIMFDRAADPTVEEMLFNRGDVFNHGFEAYLGDGGRYLTSRMNSASVQTANPAWSWGDPVHLGLSFTRAGNGIAVINGVASGAPVSLSAETGFSVSENAITYLARTSANNKYGTVTLAKFALYNTPLSAANFLAHYNAIDDSPPAPPSADIQPFMGGGFYP